MTLGMTLVVFGTSPLISNIPISTDSYTLIFLIWLAEVIAYIILWKIEEIALKVKYRESFSEYVHQVPFMISFLILRSKETDEK
jgi:protein-S-isoprenylcysteine O-methyltransferase Ste14